MNKYNSALNQMCMQCKTKPANCNKKKCVRYNNLKELVNMSNEGSSRDEIIEFVLFLIRCFDPKIFNDKRAEIDDSGLCAKDFIKSKVKELFDVDIKWGEEND